jgi:hypothetical protein
MGPELPLQRMVTQDVGMEEDPARSTAADCETRHPNDPEFSLREPKVISLTSDDEFIFTCPGRY